MRRRFERVAVSNAWHSPMNPYADNEDNADHSLTFVSPCFSPCLLMFVITTMQLPRRVAQGARRDGPWRRGAAPGGGGLRTGQGIQPKVWGDFWG